MYKTVRHGDNSLQYTILPQQEEGATAAGPAVRTAGRRHRRKGKAAAVVALTVVLICGVIATAVLVPLLLTSDLAALPAAFQQFSVASMHTVRVGGHKEVLAKKPADWRPHHIQISTTTTTTSSTTSTTVAPTTTQANPSEEEISTTEMSTTPMPATAVVTTEITKTHTTQIPLTYKPSPSEDEPRRSETTPWYKLPAVRWSMYRDSGELLIPMLAGVGVVTVAIALIVIVWMRRRRSRRNRNKPERVAADCETPDKQNLLTDPAAMSDEDQ